MKQLITFRKAQIKDLDVLEYWDTKEHVINSDDDEDWNWSFELNRNPSWRQILLAEIDHPHNNTHRFYQRLGFKFLRKQFFNSSECLVFELVRK